MQEVENKGKTQAPALYEAFTLREVEVLELIADGLSNREISQNLHLSVETIKWYNKQIFSKLGVSNRGKAVKQAKELNLLNVVAVAAEKEGRNLQSNLPAALTSYVGRRKEITELKQLLASNRLVTLTGPGGSGKTRLAIEVAREMETEYRDGVWLVELANIRDSSLVLHTIASVMGITEGSDLLEDLKLSLSQKHVLLLIDNLEHLLDSAPLIAELLTTAPELSVLGTSRERMHINGEQEYMVNPLRLPDSKNNNTSEELKEIEAIALFISRAKAARYELSLDDQALNDIAQICLQLDGLPLAIELSAPMVKVFSLSEIAARIEKDLDVIPLGPRDLPNRQQTLIKTLEWSRNLLSDDEKRLFDRLAVFTGGGTLIAIESICSHGISSNIGDLLSALLHKNLILAKEREDGQIHFDLLETIRQYNQERLIVQDEMELLSKLHVEHFTRLAEEAEPYLRGVDQIKWITQLEVEHDNLRAALAWSLNMYDATERGLRLAASLSGFWSIRGYFHEGREHLSAALSNKAGLDRTAARAKALNAAGLMAYMQSDYQKARIHLAESISINKEQGDAGRLEIADALTTLGDTESELGNYALATSLIKDALEMMRDLDNKRGIARALWQIGTNVIREGSYHEAKIYLEESLPLLRQLGDMAHTAVALTGLAEIAIRNGDNARALEIERESIALRRKIAEPWGIAVSLGNFAWIALRQNELNRSKEFLFESLSLRYELGDKGGCAWCMEKLAEISLVIGQGESSSQDLQEFQRAARLLGAAEALRASVNSAIDWVDVPDHKGRLDFLHEQLTEEAFAVAFAEGQAMTLEQAFSYSLSNSLD